MKLNLTLKIVFSIIFSGALLSCKSDPERVKKILEHNRTTAIRDSISADSTMRAMKFEADITSGRILKDTIGSYKSPVQITSSSLVKREYGTYKDIKLIYKNVSKKKISAIKFRWKGIDAFGDPADMGGYTKGFGGGFTDDILAPSKSDYGTWDMLSNNAKKITVVWVTEVAFSDGTKWFIDNNLGRL